MRCQDPKVNSVIECRGTQVDWCGWSTVVVTTCVRTRRVAPGTPRRVIDTGPTSRTDGGWSLSRSGKKSVLELKGTLPTSTRECLQDVWTHVIGRARSETRSSEPLLQFLGSGLDFTHIGPSPPSECVIGGTHLSRYFYSLYTVPRWTWHFWIHLFHLPIFFYVVRLQLVYFVDILRVCFFWSLVPYSGLCFSI